MPKVKPNYKLIDREFVREQAEVNILLIGDANVGKTVMIHNYLHNVFNENLAATAYISATDIYNVDRRIFDARLKLTIQDCAGGDEP